MTDAALAGVTAAAAMYGKYWSIFLIAGLGVAALADPRRAVYFRSPAPWVTVAVGALALAPHVAWLVANGFEPFSYAVLVHGGTSVMSALGAAFGYLAGSVGYVAVAVVIAVLAARPSAAAVRTACGRRRPSDGSRRWRSGRPCCRRLWLRSLPSIRLTSLWSMPAWTLLPVMLLSSPLVAVDRQVAARVLMVAVLFPLVILAVAPAIAVVTHRAGVTPAAAHSSLLAAPVERLWRETSDQPLRLFSSYEDFNYGVAFYLPSRPLTGERARRRSPGGTRRSDRARRHRAGLSCASRRVRHMSRTPAPRAAGGKAHRGERHPPLLGYRGTIGALSDHRHSAAAAERRICDVVRPVVKGSRLRGNDS